MIVYIFNIYVEILEFESETRNEEGGGIREDGILEESLLEWKVRIKDLNSYFSCSLESRNK